MKKFYVLLVFTLLILPGAGFACSYRISTVRIIACFKSPVHPEMYTLESGYVKFGVKELDEISIKYRCMDAKSLGMRKDLYVLQFRTMTKAEDIVKEFESSKIIKYAEEDHKGHAMGVQGISPNDAFFSNQWGLHNDGTFIIGNPKIGADVHAEEAWQVQKGSSDIIVAILDGGCKLDHPDFAGRWWINADESINTNDDDNDGYVDNLNGWDFVNDDNDPSDDNGHGTNVTSIIAANGNNNIGYAGMDWNCKLIANKVLDNNGNGFYSYWIDAIYYSIYHDARVINMSVGGTDTSRALKEAVMYADTMGVTIVASMGNDNSNQLNYPAAYPTVIAVGATNPDDTRCNPFSWGGGSNFGSDISVVAPGNYIYGLSYLSDTTNDIFWGGTSQSAPFVTGLASLILAQNPSYTSVDVKRIIENSADDQVGNPNEDTKGWDQYYGYGRINAGKTLNMAAGVESNRHDALGLRIWPNPTIGNFEIDYTLSGDQNSTVNIYDMQGRIIESKNLGKQIPGKHNGNISTSVSSGIYMLQICGDKYSSLPVKLIVR